VRPKTNSPPDRSPEGRCWSAISRVLFPADPERMRRSVREMIICLGWPSPATSSSLPAAFPPLESSGSGLVGVGHTSPPIWPCSDWGLPCHHCYQRCGGLLPHRFTLTLHPGVGRSSGRSVLCGPVRRLAAPRRYLAVYPVELGLSSDTLRRPRSPRLTSRHKIMKSGAGSQEPGRGKCRFYRIFQLQLQLQLPAPSS
jgi:hypothetical protein